MQALFIHTRRITTIIISLVVFAVSVLSSGVAQAQAVKCPANIKDNLGQCSCPVGTSDMDCQALMGPWPNWDPLSNNYASCDAAAATALTGSDNAQKVYNFLIGKGLKPWMAAGFLGNIWEESAHEFDPTIVQGGGHADNITVDGVTGYGIIQWTSKGRQQGLADLAKERGVKSGDLGVQLEYIWQELNTGYTTSTLNPLLASTNVTDATHIIELHYEIHAAPPIHPIRTEKAIGYLALYGSGAGDASATVPATAVASGCGAAAGALGGAVDGFIFPLVTTQGAIKGNKPYPWCSTAMANCHHDYNAADIMTAEGTQVVAAYPGTVVMTENIAGKNADVAIMGDDKNVYFYQHMAPGSLQVQKGAKVTAGTPLGKVGNRAAAFGTDPHLHFDMLPPPNTNRMGCASAACSKYPFINVQPILVKAFQALPQ